MNILDKLTDKFSSVLDSALMQSSQYRTASAKLNDFTENKISTELADALNDIIGDLSSAIFHASVKAGMKLGAAIASELLGGENHVP